MVAQFAVSGELYESSSPEFIHNASLATQLINVICIQCNCGYSLYLRLFFSLPLHLSPGCHVGILISLTLSGNAFID